jgi:hypothetical protein
VSLFLVFVQQYKYINKYPVVILCFLNEGMVQCEYVRNSW